MNEVMYLKEVGNQIICTNYFGQNLEKKRKFPIYNFELNHRIKSISMNGQELFIMLNSEVVIVFKNINMLKNEIFKDLADDLRFEYIKYYFKTFANNANFHIRRTLENSNRVTSLMSVILAGVISFTHIANTNNGFFKSLNSDTYETLNVNDLFEASKFFNTDDLSNNSTNETSITYETLTSDDEESLTNETIVVLNPDDYPKYIDEYTNEKAIVGNKDFYQGEVYDDLVTVMNNSQKTTQMNIAINNYIANNLEGVMWANAVYLNYNEYTIPDKYKNGEFTLDELFTDAANTFNIPKDILVAVSQHECGQGYYPINSYKMKYEKNCGGMMGFLDISNLSPNHLPQGGYDGCDINTNPVIPIYNYASTVRFFYDNFKDIDVGYGLDAWDIALAMIAIGPGDVSNINVGFKYRQDYEDRGWSQLNICAPQFKALREAYKNNMLGVNDLTFTAENGVITHWTDGQLFYYNNGEVNLKRDNNQLLTLSK